MEKNFIQICEVYTQRGWFIHKDEHMLMSIVNRSNLNINFVDIPLSAHVSYTGLVETLEKLSPDCAIYVHGLGIDR